MSDPKVLHDLEQMGAAVRMFSRVLMEFYTSLVEEGFTPAQALTLTAAYLSATTPRAGTEAP